MLKLSKKTDYALLILSIIKKEKEFVSLSKVVENTNLPQRFIARIAAELAGKKFLVSREGRVGGYKIGDRFAHATVYEFLSLFEPSLHMVDCQEKKHACTYARICTHRKTIQTRMNESILNVLRTIRLSELIA